MQNSSFAPFDEFKASSLFPQEPRLSTNNSGGSPNDPPSSQGTLPGLARESAVSDSNLLARRARKRIRHRQHSQSNSANVGSLPKLTDTWTRQPPSRLAGYVAVRGTANDDTAHRTNNHDSLEPDGIQMPEDMQKPTESTTTQTVSPVAKEPDSTETPTRSSTIIPPPRFPDLDQHQPRPNCGPVQQYPSPSSHRHYDALIEVQRSGSIVSIHKQITDSQELRDHGIYGGWENKGNFQVGGPPLSDDVFGPFPQFPDHSISPQSPPLK
jgi:hypothetical protein